MSKILVLGRTMDMGGTEVAMAALLQKLVEKKEDVTLLLVEKRGVLLERIPKEVEVRQMIWDKKPHPALERIVGKRETPAERSFYARGMGVFLMRVVYGKKRYGKLYERILECVEPETKQYDLVFDFFGFGAFTTAFGARKTNARKKAVTPWNTFVPFPICVREPTPSRQSSVFVPSAPMRSISSSRRETSFMSIPR